MLVVTALPEELAALLAIGASAKNGWVEAQDSQGRPFYRCVIEHELDEPILVAAATAGEMTGVPTATRAKDLLSELKPDVLAMCGICAGKKGDVFLGDVIVAERVYAHDHGKLVAPRGGDGQAAFFRDIKTHNLDNAWRIYASSLAKDEAWSDELAGLVRSRPISKEAQRRWLLHALYEHAFEGGKAPRDRPERRERCPSWGHKQWGRSFLTELVNDGLIDIDGGAPALTEEGRRKVLHDKAVYPDGLPEDPSFKVHVAPIGSGGAVQEDPMLFDRLKAGARKTLGVEMEAAALAYVAEQAGKRWIVAKAVSDFGDHDKDDAYREFACQVSAAFLMQFLRRHGKPARSRGRAERATDLDPLAQSRSDLVERVERVCRARDQDAKIVERRARPPLAGILELTIKKYGHSQILPLGVVDGPATDEAVEAFAAVLEGSYSRKGPYFEGTLVHTGDQTPEVLQRKAKRRGLALTSFSELQGLIDFTPYLEWQTARLDESGRYPSALYVEQHASVSVAGQGAEITNDTLTTLCDLLDSPHPRFALILGDVGTGKTFLLHELARRMAKDKHPATPVLVELRALEKAHSLNPLLAQHLAKADVGRIDLSAFRYMLAEGRMALLFDGFDELALRVSYERALEHFATVAQAAEGNAKVVVTSRTQHFLTDTEVKKELARRAEVLPGYRLFKLLPFDKAQIRRFLVKRLGSEEGAEERLQLLAQVRDLLGLSENPRMLSFIAEIPVEELRAAEKRDKKITSATLYGILISRWLNGEYARANPEGAPDGLTLEQLWAGAVELARLLWTRIERSVRISDLPAALLQAVQAATERPPVDAEETRHQLGSGSLLVRDEHGSFSFLHQSILEWLIAREAARDVRQGGASGLLVTNEMSALMADFFADLAGPDPALRWARKALEGEAEEAAKKNANLVLRRIGTPPKQPARGIDFAGQDLSGQDFSGQDLRGASFRRANLRNATLSNADLSNADLTLAQLSRADLSGAALVGASLVQADLSFARLLGADLRRSKLDGAQLRAAKLVGAKLDEGTFSSAFHAAGASPPSAAGIEPMMLSMSDCLAITWSPQNDLLIAGGLDGLIRIWDRTTGQMIRTLAGHTAAVIGVAVSFDGATLISGAEDGTIRRWEIVSGRCLSARSVTRESIESIAIGPDGRWVALGLGRGAVELWEVASGKEILLLQCHALSLAFSADGESLITGEADGRARLWQIQSGKSLYTWEGRQGPVSSIAMSSDGKTLAMGAEDRTVRLVDVTSGRTIGPIRGHRDKVASVAVSPDGALLASGSYDRTVQIWDITSGRNVRILKGHKGIVLSVRFSPDGALLASGSVDKSLRLWDTSAVRREDRADGTTVVGPRVWVHANFGGALRTLEARSGLVTSVCFSPDGSLLAIGSDNGAVRIIEIGSGRTLRLFKAHVKSIESLAFTSDCQMLASGSADRIIHVWDMGTEHARRFSLKEQPGPVLALAFYKKGEVLASSTGDGAIKHWAVSSGRLSKTSKSLEGESIALSSDGATIAIGTFGRISLRNDVSGKVQQITTAVRWAPRLAFSADGSLLVEAAGNGRIQLWDTATVTSTHSFELPFGAPRSIAISPDNAWLAVGTSDGAVRTFNLATGAPRATYVYAPEGWAAFTPDGRYKIGGAVADSLWHVIGLCRFEPGELDAHLPKPLRVPDDEPFFTP